MTPKTLEKVFERSCLNKSNLTEEIANRIIDKALSERKQLLYYYKCQFCGSHHLTSNPPYEAQPNRQVQFL